MVALRQTTNQPPEDNEDCQPAQQGDEAANSSEEDVGALTEGVPAEQGRPSLVAKAEADGQEDDGEQDDGEQIAKETHDEILLG